MMRQNILFVSQSYSDYNIAEYTRNTKAALDYAANNLSRAIMNGFEENDCKVDILNYPLIGSFPLYYKKPFVSGYKSDDGSYESISYFNMMYFKRTVITRKMYSRIWQWCKKKEGEKIIFFYEFTFVPIIEELKAEFKDLKVFVLVADLPEFMSSDNGIVTRIHHLMGGGKPASGSYYNLIDGYILLAPAMKDRLPMEGKPWIQVEGIYNPESDDVVVEKDPHKVILYTGDLGTRYGITDLVDAFHGIEDPDYRLWICGKGDGLPYILQVAQQDQRINYMGCLPRKEIITLQKKATLLVNPRKSNEEYTKYSFPSKTMEYMASGTPTLMSHLQCMPDDYSKHLFYFEKETVEGLRESIIKICSMPSETLSEIGNGASKFILENKMPQPQVKKIIDFITK